MVVQVIVPGDHGERLTINLCDTEEQLKSITVRQLKEKAKARIDAGDPEGCRTVGLELSFQGKDLDGDSTPLSQYGIKHMSVLDITSIAKTL